MGGGGVPTIDGQIAPRIIGVAQQRGAEKAGAAAKQRGPIAGDGIRFLEIGDAVGAHDKFPDDLEQGPSPNRCGKSEDSYTRKQFYIFWEQVTSNAWISAWPRRPKPEARRAAAIRNRCRRWSAIWRWRFRPCVRRSPNGPARKKRRIRVASAWRAFRRRAHRRRRVYRGAQLPCVRQVSVPRRECARGALDRLYGWPELIRRETCRRGFSAPAKGPRQRPRSAAQNNVFRGR